MCDGYTSVLFGYMFQFCEAWLFSFFGLLALRIAFLPALFLLPWLPVHSVLTPLLPFSSLSPDWCARARVSTSICVTFLLTCTVSSSTSTYQTYVSTTQHKYNVTVEH